MSSSNSSTLTPTSNTTSTNTTLTPTSSSSSGGTSSAVAGTAIGISVLVVLVFAFICLRRRRKRKQRDLESSRNAGDLNLQSQHSLSGTPPWNSTDENAPTRPMLPLAFAGLFTRNRAIKSEDEFGGSSQFGPRTFSYRELSIATKNFSRSELLGAGGFGSVYRGMLPDDSTYVAVKCIAQKSSQGAKEYKAEVTIISDLRHRNLVRLRGWCHEQGKFLLVYDYMPNGSLDRLLFDESGCTKLTWERRYSIASGLGSAVQYLHEECDKVIIHRDIKSSNLLLDENFNAKLGDFGLSRQVEQGITSHTTTIAGTRGYMAPECFFGSGKATRGTDVFAFGAVLLELVCGKHVIDWSLTENEGMLVDWVWNLHGQGRVMEAVDRRLEGRYEEEEAKRMLLVGLMCSNPDPKGRPRMRRALETLMGSVSLPVVPPYRPSLLFGPSLSMSFTDNSSGATSTSTPSSIT